MLALREEVDLDPHTIYPMGDEYITLNPIGCLLLFAASYFYKTGVEGITVQSILDSQSSKILLLMHQRMVNEFIDDASLNTLDAIVFVGLLVAERLSAEDFPPFHLQNPACVSVLRYAQVLSISSQITEENCGSISDLCMPSIEGCGVHLGGENPRLLPTCNENTLHFGHY
jgi:hypothetical protein